MSIANKAKSVRDEMLPEYDFSDAVQGKYYKRFQRMRLKIMIDPDVARVFPDSQSVNAVLRELAHSGWATPRKAGSKSVRAALRELARSKWIVSRKTPRKRKAS